MLTKKKRIILFWLSIGAFALLLIPVFLYSFGYGVGPGFTIQKTGAIAVTISESGASVSVGRAKRKTTSLISKTALIKNLVPGRYEVVAEKDGFWPWRRELAVFSERVTVREILLFPLAVAGTQLGDSIPSPWEERMSKEPYVKRGTLFVSDETGRMRTLVSSVKKFWALPQSNNFLIWGDDGKFYKNRDAFNPALLLSLSSGEDHAAEIFTDLLISSKNLFFGEDGDRAVFWDRYSIDSYWIGALDKMPEWQKEYQHAPALRLTHIFSAPDILRAVLPYPKEDNYLIVEMQNGIFALEMEFPRNNTAPLYKGKRPTIVSIYENTLLILDEGNFIEIKLP